MQFRINYTKVMSQANEISDKADELENQIKRLEQMEQDCRSVWQGEAADAFLAKLTALRGVMGQTRTQMATLAQTIRTCARNIQREDEEAAERAAALNASIRY